MSGRSPGFPLTRRSLGAFVGMPLAFASARSADPWSALRGAGHVALIRHASAPGVLDPPDFKLDDCSTQRNLSAEGRAQAIRMGDLLRANGIAAARIHSSQWCRCLDTATLMKLGEVTQQPLLNYFGQDQARRSPQLEALRAWIARLELAQPTLLVTHQVVISDITQSAAQDGEIFVLRREADGRLVVVGRQSTM
ncbi:Histidine phosphatase superfamily (branch 1) [Rhodospirillales bacterium URHD0017]|nr:Histidine phosphatase superfamily (branch 1) [Rhodospirillales bacterium URHD0017]